MDQTKTKKTAGIVAGLAVVIAAAAYFSQGNKANGPKGLIYPDTTWTTVQWAVDPFQQNIYTMTTAKKVKGYTAPMKQSGDGQVDKEVKVVLDSGYLVPRIGFSDSAGHQSMDSLPRYHRALLWVPVPYQSILQDFNKDWIPQSHHYMGQPTLPFFDNTGQIPPSKPDTTKKDTSKPHK